MFSNFFFKKKLKYSLKSSFLYKNIKIILIIGMETSDKIIVEEIKSKNGENSFRQYQKGKFLGKVNIFYFY